MPFSNNFSLYFDTPFFREDTVRLSLMPFKIRLIVTFSSDFKEFHTPFHLRTSITLIMIYDLFVVQEQSSSSKLSLLSYLSKRF